MCDYSIYNKTPIQFSMENPHPRSDNNDKICFRIILINRKLKIFIYKDESLEDLYIKIYNAVYPEFSTEKIYDKIPSPNDISYESIPKIYNVALVDNNENVSSIPLHRFITISSFIKTKPECFKNTSFLNGTTYKIYVIDEYTLKNAQNIGKQESTNYIGKYIRCFTNKNKTEIIQK
jgi:ribosomal protein L20A (L18A)